MRKLLSLGFRCDVAFQLRMHSGDNTSQFFDWLATPPEGVVKILDRNFDVFHPDHLERSRVGNSDCIIDRLSGVIFWHQFPIEGGTIATPHLLFYPGFLEKFTFLAQRFRKTVTEGPVTLFRTHISEPVARVLEQSFFRIFPNADAQFRYVVNTEAHWQTPHGRTVYLPPTEKSLGDPVQWIRMLSEEGLIGRPYRLATAEILGQDHDDYNLSPDNRFTEAELLAAISAAPASGPFRIELARLHISRNRLAPAIEQLDAAVALDRTRQDWAIERVVALWRLGQISAMDGAAAVTGMTVGHLLQMHDFARMLVGAEQWARARLACIGFMRQRPMDGELCFLKAQSCHRLNRTIESELAVDRAIELQPGQWRYHLLRATILAAGNKLAAALAASEAAVKLEDNEATRAARADLRQRVPAGV